MTMVPTPPPGSFQIVCLDTLVSQSQRQLHGGHHDAVLHRHFADGHPVKKLHRLPLDSPLIYDKLYRIAEHFKTPKTGRLIMIRLFDIYHR